MPRLVRQPVLNSRQVKKVLIIFFVFPGITATFGQVRPGIEAGFTVSTWLGTVEKFNYKSGFYAGGKVIFLLSDIMMMQSGVGFSREGWKDQIEIDKEEVTQILTTDYIVIPVSYGIFAIGDKYRGVKFTFGVEAKFLIADKLTNRFPDGDQMGELDVELNDFDMAGKIGIDYQIEENIAIGASVYYGFIVSNATTSSTFLVLNNQGFRMGLYYLF